MADMDNAETILPLLLGRYRVEGMLGEGGLGTVVRAFDTRLKRLVAIKTLKRGSYAEDPAHFRALEERFAREAEAGSRMGGNPHVVTVHDLATDSDGTLYLVQEFVPGGSVADRIARGPLPVAEALAIAADAAEGLQAAHEKGIVHRDIKPANLFLAEDGRALVGDFGIAQVDNLSARTHAVTGHPGTPLYMSPEQQQQSMYVRPASDQYSLGLVLFEMLTGVGYKRVGERAAERLLQSQPPQVAALITRMIAGHPDDRFASMADVVWEVRRVERQLALADTQAIPAKMGGQPGIEESPASVRDTGPIPIIAPAVQGGAIPPSRAVLPGAAAVASFRRRLAALVAGGFVRRRRFVVASTVIVGGLLLVTAVMVSARWTASPARPTDQPPRPVSATTSAPLAILPTSQLPTPTALATVPLLSVTQTAQASNDVALTALRSATGTAAANFPVGGKRYVVVTNNGRGAPLADKPNNQSGSTTTVWEGSAVYVAGPAFDGPEGPNGTKWYLVISPGYGFIKADYLRPDP